MPDTRYAQSGGVNIAYQVGGNGPVDLVYVPGWVSHVEHSWELQDLARGFERLASFSRLILFDKRGTGMSDPVPTDELPTLEQRMDDVRAVMDDVGSERAAIFGASEGGSMSMLFAATYPERTVALCTVGSTAKRVWSPDYPWAPTPQERQEAFVHVERYWKTGLGWHDLAPSLDPLIGILLNVTEDHLDRHGTLAEYAAVKERLAANNSFLSYEKESMQ